MDSCSVVIQCDPIEIRFFNSDSPLLHSVHADSQSELGSGPQCVGVGKIPWGKRHENVVEKYANTWEITTTLSFNFWTN